MKIKEINVTGTDYGTSSMGYIEHRGIRITTDTEEQIDGYFCYSSKAYGTFKTGYGSTLNGHFLSKYNKYALAVAAHFEEIFTKLEKMRDQKCNFKNLQEIKNMLKVLNCYQMAQD